MRGFYVVLIRRVLNCNVCFCPTALRDILQCGFVVSVCCCTLSMLIGGDDKFDGDLEACHTLLCFYILLVNVLVIKMWVSPSLWLYLGLRSSCVTLRTSFSSLRVFYILKGKAVLNDSSGLASSEAHHPLTCVISLVRQILICSFTSGFGEVLLLLLRSV